MSGNLDPTERYKGLAYLLEALKIVSQDIPDVLLTVVGDGGDKEYYQQMCRSLGIDSHVRFCGKLFGNDLVNEFHNSRVFIVPSVVDSTPNVILEAMSSGLPVVASDTGGIPDLVDNGKDEILRHPKYVGALADAIKRVLSDNKLAENTGREGFKKASEQYTWQKKAEETVEVIEEIIKIQNSNFEIQKL